MEGGADEVAVETVLEEILARQRGLAGEEGDVDWADGGVEGGGGGGGRFSVVVGGHCEDVFLFFCSCFVWLSSAKERGKGL